MINKNDCVSILVKLNDNGLKVDSYLKQLLIAKDTDIPVDVLRFIAKNRGFEVANFYEVLRKSYNQKKSPLYKNIVKAETTDEELPVILASLLTQISLYAKKIADTEAFFKAVRAAEITEVLNEYFVTGSLDLAYKLLAAIRSDLLVLEYIAGRRDITN